MGQPFSLWSTEALKAEFPSTSMHVMSLGFIFYNILSFESDVVNSTQGGTLMKAVILR